MNISAKTTRTADTSSRLSRTCDYRQHAQGSSKARYLLHTRGLARTSAPCETLCNPGRGIGQRGFRYGQGVRFRRGGWIAAAMVAIPPLDCREWPPCHLSWGRHGAPGDGAQRADLRTGDYTPLLVARARAQTPKDCFEAALSRPGWGALAADLWKEEHRALRGKLTPTFYNRAGEVLPRPQQFEEAIRKITAAVCCIGCKHAHVGVPPVIKGQIV